MIRDKLSLDDVEWGEFRIKDLFEIILSKGDNKANLLKDGQIPLVSSGFNNNGITKFVETGDGISEIIKKYTITVDMFGMAFFHKYDYYSVSHGRINILLPLKQQTRESLLFCVNSINKSTNNIFNYNRMCSSKRLSKVKIFLPIDKNGEPNWQFMEEYIKQEQKTIAQNVIIYYEDKIIKTGFDLLGLEDAKWGSFKIKDIFEIKAVKGKTLSSYPEGATPYVSTSSLNNGVSGYIETKDDISNEKCISIDPIAGKAFYHNYKFVGRGGAGSAINLLYNQNLDENNSQFILTMIEKVSREKASYGVALNGERLKNMRLTLPIDEKGEPNWDYMSKFMQKIEQEKLEKALNYIYIYIYSLAICEARKLPKPEEKEWGEFWLEDIVDIKSGVRLTKEKQISGTIPFVGSTDSNNGITNYISNINDSIDQNVLGVNYNGSVVENFYHPYKCVFSDDVKRLHWKDQNVSNKYTYLFLKQMILVQKEKYTYGYKFNSNRMNRQKILLPINDCGEPDYIYMKKYMQIEEIKQAYKIIDCYIKSI